MPEDRAGTTRTVDTVGDPGLFPVRMKRRVAVLGTVAALVLAGGRARGQAPAAVCRAATELVPGVRVRGSTSGGSDVFHASCAREALSHDRVYVLRLPRAARVSLRLAADFDAVLYVRSRCDDPVTELACNDDAEDDQHAALDLDLPAGTYWVFVDGYDTDSDGDYVLGVTTGWVTPAGPARPGRGR